MMSLDVENVRHHAAHFSSVERWNMLDVKNMLLPQLIFLSHNALTAITVAVRLLSYAYQHFVSLTRL